jgi:hypothetical protein
MSEETSSGTRRGFGERLVGALMLDASVYEEVEHDPDALGQAALVVALGAVAGGIAGVGGGGSGVVGGVLLAGVGWVIGAGVVWLIGVRMMDHTSDFLELLRTLGFASAPRVLMILAIIPFVGWLVGLAVLVLSLIAWVLAVRQALDVETGRAVLVCVLAFVAQIVFGFLLAIVGLGAVATAV